MAVTRVRFVTRRNCSLCDAGRERLDRMAGLLGVEVESVDVDADDALREAYGGRVPVVLGAGDRVLGEGRLSGARLAAALLGERMRADGGSDRDH